VDMQLLWAACVTCRSCGTVGCVLEVLPDRWKPLLSSHLRSGSCATRLDLQVSGHGHRPHGAVASHQNLLTTTLSRYHTVYACVHGRRRERGRFSTADAVPDPGHSEASRQHQAAPPVAFQPPKAAQRFA
jgi:hypothetical protein